MIKTYFSNQGVEWDEIVKSFSKHDSYYLSGYVKAFERNGDGKAMLIYFEDDSPEKTRAISVVMKRDISDFQPFSNRLQDNGFFDIVTPYGYGGFIIEGENVRQLKEEYEQFCKKEHIVSEFVRFHPILENWNGLDSVYDIVRLGNTVFMDTSAPETIWQNLTSKNRNMIRKAQKEGLKVFWGRDPQIIEQFIQIYNETMDKDSANDYYYFDKDFYESISEDLKHNALWFYSVKDDEIAAISIFLFCNGQMHYHLSGSKRKFSSLAPTNLLLYEAAVWASKNGYKTLHLGGGVGAAEDSLYKFKKAFNRNEDSAFCIGRKIFDNDTYQKLVDFRSEENSFDNNSSFFPLYRAK
ncbi:MAG: GNAT family N-acetyltransferase [Clostridia bacterium]|nr:GNAT family N-acetyltransferase [Clostridia bacterium]